MFVLLAELVRLKARIGLKRPQARHSISLRHVDCGSCNGCEHELGATSNPNYDIGRFGIGIVASPRHADVLVVTGPVTTRMLEPLRTAYASMPEPRRVVALGNCALGIDLLGDPSEHIGGVMNALEVDVAICGCPPTPDEIEKALLGAFEHHPSPPNDHRVWTTETIN